MAQTQLLNILFKNSWLSYVAGDVVDVYYDNTDDDFVVNKNGSPVTSGDDIPAIIKQLVRRNTALTIKIEKLYQNQICDGTDLLNFGRISAFPYLTKEVLVNHPACDLSATHVVCDLAFSALPLSTPASTATASDGTLTVAATSSNGAVEYRLNRDFVYGSGNGQTTGAFTGLAPGNYLIYARDAVNCLAVTSMNVGLTHTYGVLYRIEYYVIRLGYKVKTEILQKDYSGAVTEVTCTETPTIFRKRGEGERDKFNSIISTEMQLNLLSLYDGQFSSLYTNDQDKFRMRHSIDNGSGYEVVWIGKVLPQQHAESYQGVKYPVEVIATDGIPSLADIVFEDQDANRIVGVYKQIEIIAFILKKIGYGINIRVAINMYATGMNTTAADDPLDQAYVDCLTYYIANPTPRCINVLQMILEPYGAQILLYNNVWNIVRIEEKVNSYDYREFDEDGVYVTNGTYNPVKVVKQSGQGGAFYWEGKNANKELMPGFGEIQLIYSLGRKKDIFINGDFGLKRLSQYSNNVNSPVVTSLLPDLTGFEIVSNGTIITKSVETIENENVALSLKVKETGGYVITNSITLKMGNIDELRISIRFKVRVSTLTNQRAIKPYIRVKILIKYGDYYLLDGGQWSSGYSEISYFINNDNFNEFQQFQVVAPSPLASYYTGANFYIKVYLPHIEAYEYGTLAALRALVTTTLPEKYRVELLGSGSDGFNSNTIYYYELKNETNAENLPHSISPTDYNSVTNPYKWVLTAKASRQNDRDTILTIDKIQTELLSDGRLLPETASFSQPMENENNQIISKILYHGSLIKNGQSILNLSNAAIEQRPSVVTRWGPVAAAYSYYSGTYQSYITFTAESADVAYVGWLRNATGGDFTNWFRDSVAEEKPIEYVFMDMYAMQYNEPWLRINGTLYSHDVMLSPLDIIEDYIGDQKKFDPISLEIDYRNNLYSGEFLELKSAADVDDPPLGYGFTIGFSLGFNS